jgi:uncharacterized protein
MPPLNLLIKPASGNCNMRCRYCFYIDETENRSVASMGRMSCETMHIIVDKAMAYADDYCTFSFQGGEPTLVGPDFFKDLADFIARHPNPKKLGIHYAIQTNGYDLNEDWAKWFAENKVLVGISLDGPKEIHDRYRLDRSGNGTFRRVMNSIRMLEKHGVDYNILTVVSGANARRGQQSYQFLKNRIFAISSI